MSVYLTFYEFIDFLRCMDRFVPNISIPSQDLDSLFEPFKRFRYLRGDFDRGSYYDQNPHHANYHSDRQKNIVNLVHFDVTTGQKAKNHKAILDPVNAKFIKSIPYDTYKGPDGTIRETYEPIYNYEDILDHYTKNGNFTTFADLARFLEIIYFICENIEGICNNGKTFSYYPETYKAGYGKTPNFTTLSGSIKKDKNFNCIEKTFLRQSQYPVPEICLPDFTVYDIDAQKIDTAIQFILFPGSSLLEYMDISYKK